MSDLSRQKEELWLTAAREIGNHFAKIGEVLTRCAEDTASLTKVDVNTGRAFGSLQKSSAERVTREETRFPLKRKSIDDPVRGAASSADKPADAGERYPIPSVDRPTGGSNRRYVSLPKDASREFSQPESRNGRVSMGHDGDDVEDEEDDDEMLSERFLGKKRAYSGSLSAREKQSLDERHRKEGDHPSHSRYRVPRSMKRVRMNWTDAENATFFATIRRFATEDDNGVLHKVVAALDGSRTLIQCKGHFRNMLVVGKVVQSETEPRRWIIVEDPSEQKRTSLGKSYDSKNSGSSGASREDAPAGNREREEGNEDRLKASRSDEKAQSSHHQVEKPDDDDEDVVLDDIEDDDERDKDYQDEEGMEEEDGEMEDNESGTNNTAVRVTEVGDIDPGGTTADFENPSIGSSVRNVEDGTGKSSGMPLKKQPGGRVGEVSAAQSIDEKKPEVH